MAQFQKQLTVELKNIVVPLLRSRGFKGSFPTFNRANNDQVDYLSFWFSKSKANNRLFLDIGKFPLSAFENKDKKLLTQTPSTAELTQRFHLGPIEEHFGHWFNYNDQNLVETANQVIKFLDETIEPWWQGLIEINANNEE